MRRSFVLSRAWLSGGRSRVVPGGTHAPSRPFCRHKARTWSWRGRGWQEMSALGNQVDHDPPIEIYHK